MSDAIRKQLILLSEKHGTDIAYLNNIIKAVIFKNGTFCVLVSYLMTYVLAELSSSST